jgi:hypothetical protein
VYQRQSVANRERVVAHDRTDQAYSPHGEHVPQARVAPVTTTIAASYERVSTRIQGQHGFSLGAQHQSLAEFTKAQGWILPEHLRFRDGEEENASGADWDP